MYDAIQSPIFTCLREENKKPYGVLSMDKNTRVVDYMHYYRPVDKDNTQNGGKNHGIDHLPIL